MDCPICSAQVDDSAATCSACGQDTRFRVRAPGGADYGPYTLADVRLYARQGRVDPAAALVAADDTSYTLPELGITPILPATVARPPRHERSGMSTGATCAIIAVVGLIIVVFVGGILSAILFPVFAKAREKARQMTCLTNVKELGLAAQMYAADYKQTLPPAADWSTATYPYYKNKQLLQCPSVPNLGEQSYTFSPSLGGVNLATLSSPATEPMLWDAGLPSGSGPHNSGGNVGYADGHVKWMKNQAFSQQQASSGAAPPPAGSP